MNPQIVHTTIQITHGNLGLALSVSIGVLVSGAIVLYGLYFIIVKGKP